MVFLWWSHLVFILKVWLGKLCWSGWCMFLFLCWSGRKIDEVLCLSAFGSDRVPFSGQVPGLVGCLCLSGWVSVWGLCPGQVGGRIIVSLLLKFWVSCGFFPAKFCVLVGVSVLLSLWVFWGSLYQSGWRSAWNLWVHQISCLPEDSVGEKKDLLWVSVFIHIWNLPEVCPSQILGLLVSFCWSSVCLGSMLRSCLMSALGTLFRSGCCSSEAICDLLVQGLLGLSETASLGVCQESLCW